MSPQLARRVAIVGTLSLGPVRDPVLPPVVPPGPLERSVRPRGVAQLHPAGGDRGAPGRDPRPHRDDPRPSQRAYAVMISPPDLPVPLTEKNLAHPPRADAALYNLLAHVVGLPTKRQPCHVNGARRRCISHLADRLRGRPGVRAAALRRGHGGHRHHPLAALLPVRAPGRLPGRQRPADLSADLSARRRRVPGAGDRQPDHGERGQGPVLQGSVPERLGRAVGPGGLLRPLPARRGRRPAGPGRRAGQLRRRPVADPADCRQQPQAVARLQARSGRPAGAPGVDRLQLPGQRRRVRRPEPGQRPGLRDGLAAHLQREPVQQTGPHLGLQRDVRPQLGRPAGQPGLPERRADGIHVQADHLDRGARERRVEHQQHLRRHRAVLHLEPVPAQRRQRRRRLARPGERDQGLLGRLLLQPGGADQLAGAQWRAAPALGKPLRDRPQDRRRPPRRERRDAARREVARCAQQARGRVRQGHRAVQGQAQASAGWLRDRLRRQPPMVDRRQREPRGRPGRRAGHAAPACGGLRGDRQRWHDRHAAPGARRAVA